ncbi:MAG TPA: Gfo/Idh/MocA family oxidoreductase [Coriobacteriia bacterium]|nr:Gfo/Idh/MocA family oxidoreductase [Coriobacteriia bacterium]
MTVRESPKTKVAVLSFAHGHSVNYLRYLQGRGDVDLLAYDPDGAGSPDAGPRGQEVATAYGVAYADSYEKALAWRPDAVVICSENTKHRELVEQAAAAGAHILCEKPLATSTADAAEMLSAVERAGVTLMVAFPVRFAPSFEDLKAQVKAGRVGDVLAVLGTNNGKIPLSDRRWFTDPALSGGGCFVDHIVHCADLLDSLLGQRAAAVRAVSNRILHAETGVQVETGGLVTIMYEGGVIATIDCSWSQPMTAPSWGGVTLEVVGTKGSIKISPFASHVGGDGADGAIWLPYGADLDAKMIDEFLAGVREARQPQPDGRVGLRTVAIMNAAQLSARTGRVVVL